MRATLLVGLLMGLLVASTFAQEVVVLDNASFDDAIAKHDLVLVEFFAPWCGHCKSLAPKFAAAAEALHAQGITNAILASVDCTVETELAQRFSIEGYPTLIAFKKEAKIPYNGARETDAIIGFIKKKAAPAVQAVTKASDIDAFASAGAIVLFGGSSDDLAVFSAAADSDEIYNYYHVSDAAVIEATGAASPSLKLFRTFSTTPAVSTSFPLTAASLAEFVEANGFPAVSEINQDSYQRLSKRPYPLVILVVDTENTELKEQWLATLNTLAAEFPTLSLTYGPSSQLLNAVKQFGGTGDFLPSFIGFIVPGMSTVDTTLPARFAWPEDVALTEESARTWLQSVADGKPSINKKSEPIPEDNSGPVKVVVARTFDEIVLQSGKSVLVEFYAPWCGHCKSLAPIYEELGKKFAGNDKVAVAKIDATENYVDPAYNIQGFPTLILFKPDGSRVAYESDRTLEAFEAFLLQHTGEAGAAGSEHDEL